MIPRPADLPDLRLLFIDEWRDQRSTFRQLLVARTMVEGEPPMNPLAEIDVLERATLWYVNSDMIDLIAQAAPKMPPTMLTEDLMPAQAGLVLFAKPLFGIDVQLDGPSHVDALSWGWFEHDRSSRGAGVEIACYARIRDEKAHQAAFDWLAQKGRTPRGWVPLGGGFWSEGTANDFPNTGMPSVDASNEEDRRWLTTLWLLSSQTLATVTKEPMPRKMVKRSERENIIPELVRTVRFVDVRRAKSQRANETNGESSGREYSHRWVVGAEQGGFWRRQAIGPKHGQHKLTWIMPYIAGPDDKPLVVKDTVRIVRGDAHD